MVKKQSLASAEGLAKLLLLKGLVFCPTYKNMYNEHILIGWAFDTVALCSLP